MIGGMMKRLMNGLAAGFLFQRLLVPQIDMMPWIEERLVPDAFATMAVTVWPGLEF
jgi:hypothetical protein